MGIGLISLQTTQKKEQAGPPFVSGSANNGLSVDTGVIVLGNAVGLASRPARLLSNREIVTGTPAPGPTGPFNIQLNNLRNSEVGTIAAGSISLITTNAARTMSFNATASTGAFTQMSAGGGNALLTVSSGAADTLVFHANGSGFLSFEVGGGSIVMAQIKTSTFKWQFGNTQVTFNEADVQISGTMTAREYVNGVTGAVTVDRDLDTSRLFFNNGATTLNMPNLAGANDRTGFNIRVAVTNVAGITIQLDAGQTIRFGSLVTSSGGTLSSTDVGAFVRIVNISAGSYVTETFNGAWVLT